MTSCEVNSCIRIQQHFNDRIYRRYRCYISFSRATQPITEINMIIRAKVSNHVVLTTAQEIVIATLTIQLIRTCTLSPWVRAKITIQIINRMVIPCSADTVTVQDVMVATTDQNIGTCTTFKKIIAPATFEKIIFSSTLQRIIATIAAKSITTWTNPFDPSFVREPD